MAPLLAVLAPLSRAGGEELAPGPRPAPVRSVLVVDDEPGPDVDFQDLQAAIDAAVPGDVVLLRDGTYDVGGGIMIEDGLVLQADEAAVIDFVQNAARPVIEIRDLPPERTVVLRGLRSTDDPSLGSEPFAARLLVSGCEGVVWIEDCDFASEGSSEPAVDVVGASSVVASRCRFLGNAEVNPSTTLNGHALRAVGSEVHLLESSAVVWYCPQSGVRLDSSFLFASGSTIAGGIDDCFSCTVFGAGGGAGLEATNGSAAALRDTTVSGGHGGDAFFCPPTPPGPQFLEDATSIHVFFPGPHLGYDATAPRREREVVRRTFRGPPGHEVHLIGSRTTRPLFEASLGGSLFVPPSATSFVGVIPASGELVSTLGVPPLAGPGEASVRYSQAVFVDPAAPLIEVGSASVQVTLDRSVDTSLLDCNRNGLHDPLDVAGYFSLDCNRNGVPDTCDTSSGTSEDCNANAVPDECETARFLGVFDLETLGMQDLTISDMDATEELLVVGTREYDDDEGAVLVFRYDGQGALALEAVLQASDPGSYWFGEAVSVEGERVAVGENRDAYVFERDQAGVWVERARIPHLFVPNAVAFGADVALQDGILVVADSRASLGGDVSGGAFVFREENGLWIHQDTLEGSKTNFSFSFPYVRVEIEGDVVLVGTESTQFTEAGSVHVYLRDDRGTPGDASDDDWIEAQELGDGMTQFGAAMAVGEQDTLFVGSLQHALGGAVLTFDRQDAGTPGDPLDDTWSQGETLTASDAESCDRFGESLDVDGDVLLVGTGNLFSTKGHLNASAYLFHQRPNGRWREEEILFPLVRTGHDFGRDVALVEDLLFVTEGFGRGSARDGSVHAFARSDDDFDGVPNDCELAAQRLVQDPLPR